MTTTGLHRGPRSGSLFTISMALGLITVLCCVQVSSAQRIVWQDDDPGLESDGSGGEFDVPSDGNIGFNGGGLAVTLVDGLTATGDASRALVGEVVLPIADGQKFKNFNSGTLAIDPEDQGNPFRYTLDYFIPTDTTLDALPDDSSPDLFYVQMNFDAANSGSAGFVGVGQAGTGWSTITLDGTVPSGATSAQAFGLIVDGGFGAGVANGTGEGAAIYVDNILFTVGAPENGDFDRDGDIDGPDFLVWQDRLNDPINPDNPTTATSPEDLAIWLANYPMGPGASVAVSAVPEPSVLALLLGATPLALGRMRRR